MEELPAARPEPAVPAPASRESSSFNPIPVLRDIGISVILAVVLIVFIYQPVKVEGTSMMPGLTDQERIFINKYEYKLGVDFIARGDLVVFHFPLDPNQSYIKRVIGVPGDVVEIVDGNVFVNGRALDEPYVLPEYRDHLSTPRTVVPMNNYFVLGDHRNSSNDSRTWGFVDRPKIYGKAVFVYWPPNKIGRVH
ncbi:MAG TPA: signal peptidase I [Bryobacteraceae bacterium]|jgi:signal peptidase I|nr:signal peptidase I [Bryobacteraceae bacterium]